MEKLCIRISRVCVCMSVVINEVSALMRFGFEFGSKLAHQMRNGNFGCTRMCLVESRFSRHLRVHDIIDLHFRILVEIYRKEVGT